MPGCKVGWVESKNVNNLNVSDLSVASIFQNRAVLSTLNATKLVGLVNLLCYIAVLNQGFKTKIAWTLGLDKLLNLTRVCCINMLYIKNPLYQRNVEYLFSNQMM